jgi:hypothetical protein
MKLMSLRLSSAKNMSEFLAKKSLYFLGTKRFMAEIIKFFTHPVLMMCFENIFFAKERDLNLNFSTETFLF